MSKIACVAVVKDEGPHIAEWIGYQYAIGFDTVILINNASEDATVARATQAAAGRDLLILESTDDSRDYQRTAYLMALGRFSRDFAWMAFFDADEFLVLEDLHLKAALNKHDATAAIAVSWAIFGSSGNQQSSPGRTIETYLRRSLPSFGPNKHVKSIIRPGLAEDFLNGHMFRMAKPYKDLSGRDVQWLSPGIIAGVPDYRGGKLHHYFTRSWTDWQAKLRRGYPDLTRELSEFEQYDRNEVLDDTALTFVARAAAALVADSATGFDRAKFDLSTVHGWRLYVSADSRQLVAASPDQAREGFSPVYAVLFQSSRYIGLVADNGADFAISRQGLVCRIHLLRAYCDAASGDWTLRDPMTLRRLAIDAAGLQPGQHDTESTLADSRSLGMSDRFSATAHAGPAAQPEDREVLQRMEAFLSKPDRAKQMILEVTIGQAAGILQSMMPLLSSSEWEDLASAYILDETFRRGLTRSFADDPWALTILPELLNWDQLRRAGPARPRISAISASSDYLAAADQDGCFMSVPQAINHYVRQRVDPLHNACLVALMRNDSVDFLEWAAYHKAIGFDELFIFGGEDGCCADELKALAESGVINWFRSNLDFGTLTPAEMHAYALSMLPDSLDYRWMILADPDQFFTFDPEIFISLDDFLAFHETTPQDAFVLQELCFSSGGADDWQEGLLAERCTVRLEPNAKSRVSWMFRPNAFSCLKMLQAAAAGFSVRQRPPRGNNATGADGVICRYVDKSAQEFLWDCSFGHEPQSANGRNLELDDEEVSRFLNRRLLKGGRPEFRVLRCCPQLHTAVADLLAMPHVRQAHEAVIRRFTQALQELMLAHAVRAARQPVTELQRKLLELANVPVIEPL